jgi:aminoglycoside phosphotransferase (APT) family kinase protein
MTDEQKTLSEYQQFIHAKHERLFNTPHEVIDQAVQKATGSSMAGKDRIVKGESNEVHAIKTDSGKEVIVRISHNEHPNFERERWAIEASAKVGVPVPDILLIDKAEHKGKSLAISIEAKLPGVALSELTGKISDAEYSDFIRQAGKILSQIHSVKVGGFGDLDKNGKGKRQNIQEVLLDPEITEEQMLKIAAEVQLDQTVVTKAMEILKQGAASYPVIDPRLLHNDFGPKHFLIHEGKISGILDFENCEGGDPVQEFARWDFFGSNKPSWNTLKEGYEDQTLFEGDFEQRFRLWKVFLGVQHLEYYKKEENPSGIQLAKDRLTKDIQYW